ncbi:DUF924 family protein [Stakelama sediminis]|uniref:Uncharacterized protein (DUF924 family) n=1 Tax=Stakelama sediminis TaxID=463200 RepID=A0A840Z0B3_9SPHN|nr:DUF924 family protein [Stakelama sediminis]MBB5719408.1 uncharacterized protein (DUF924 family) [Stakelama sediminis]
MTKQDAREQARAILAFWFEECAPEQHFGKDDTLDTEIVRRFSGLRDAVLSEEAAGWRDDPETLLAAVILLDQFSRNIHRGEAEAFAADPLALDLTQRAIERGWDKALPPDRRAFLYMPLMHSERADMQAQSLKRFAEPGLEQSLDFARQHASVITEFGRFPGRNAALGRESTPAESAWLSRSAVDW